jgi:hypothetical protein
VTKHSVPAEVGPPMNPNPKPSNDECYAVSSWIGAELRSIPREIRNIPWWQLNRRRRAWKKYRQFGVAFDVVHYYVYPGS